MTTGIDEGVARFRETYRATEIPSGYRGWGHALFIFGFGTAALIGCLLQLKEVRALEWFTVPVAFLYSNLAEYVGHRFPMHRPVPGLGNIYNRHAGQHHRFFTHRAMELESQRDLRAVLFPPVLVVFFFGVFGVPIWLLFAWAVSANVAWLFIATGLAYYLNYEVLHLSYHAPAQSRLARIGAVARLRLLHQTHHDPSVMAKCNFNITYPIADWLFRTLKRGPDAR